MRLKIITTGLAMFSMFFGAGNVVFPLALGQMAGENVSYAILGLLVTAVGVPFAGLLAMVLFEGNYRNFFSTIGEVPGFFVITFLMVLNGPMGAIPRCVTLPYFAMKQYIPGITLFSFTLFLCLLILLLTYKKTHIVNILGKVLSPVLLTILGAMIVMGLISHPSALPTDYTGSSLFYQGLNEGYLTMDLLGALFFSGVAFTSLRKAMGKETDPSCPTLMKFSLKTCFVGALLLSIVYVGFCYVASFHGIGLNAIDKDQLLAVIASRVLGSSAAIFANIAVLFACLTTAVTLVVVFADFMRNEIFKKKISYNFSLIATILATFAVSNMGFMGILNMISPILLVAYPVLIVLTIFNILNKLFGITFVKVPVLVTSLIVLFLFVSR